MFGRARAEHLERLAQKAEAERAARGIPSKAQKGSYAGATSGRVVNKGPAGKLPEVRDSAKGEDCTVRLPGCPFDPEKTIWSHYRGSAGGKAMGFKSFDLAGCYACTFCDGIYDGQIKRPEGVTKEDVDLAWHDGHIRSLVRLAEKGLL